MRTSDIDTTLDPAAPYGVGQNDTENPLTPPFSPMDEKITVELTRFELKKIRDWNRQRMDAAAQALENMMMKPYKRSRWQCEYDFHAQLCDRLYGVDPDEEDRIREHNEGIKSQLDVMERAMADIRAKYEETKKMLV